MSMFSWRGLLRLVFAALCVLTALLSVGTLAAKLVPCTRPPLPQRHELFDSHLAGIDTIDEAIARIERTRPSNPAAFADATDAFLRERFIHGYSTFRPCQDWVAWVAGAVWFDLKSPVNPEQIMAHRRAACSQQSIVFQEIMRRNGLDVRSIGLPGHFVSAVDLGGRWYVYDANKEIPVRRYPISWLQQNDPRLAAIYPNDYKSFRASIAAGRLQLGGINANPAPQALLFHAFTRFLSEWGWLVSALLAIAAYVSLRPHRRRAGRGVHSKPSFGFN